MEYTSTPFLPWLIDWSGQRHAPAALSRYLLNMALGESQSWPGNFGEDKKMFNLCRKSIHDSSYLLRFRTLDASVKLLIVQ